MKIKSIIYFIFLLAPLLFIGGCEMDEKEIEAPTETGNTIRVNLAARVDPVSSPKSAETATATARSTDTTEPRTYYGMLLQFDAGGGILHHTSIQAIEINENKQFSLPEFELRPGENQTLILVVTPDTDALTPFSSLNSLSEFNRSTVAWNGIIDSDQLPLTGRLDRVSVSESGIVSTNDSAVFGLKRLGCRIDFSYSFNVPGYTLKQIVLHNLPKAMATTSGEGTYPILTDAGELMKKAVTPIASDGYFQWFIPANARGTGSNTTGNAKQKTGTNAPDGFCTYLQIECSNNTAGNENVRFNLYLGDDAINDFNLKSNHAYRITAQLTGLDENDLRIEGLGTLEAWIEVKDLDQLHGDKTFASLHYTLDNGEIRNHAITRTIGNRYYYTISGNNNGSQRIRHIEFRNASDHRVILHQPGGLQIESEGDANIPADAKTLQEGISYSWLLQGIYNRAGEYEVCSGRTLTNVRRLLNATFRQTNDISLHAYTSWEPIGSYAIPFRGSYHGDGYRISGMQLVQRNTTKAIGLFGAISDAALDGVRIAEDGNIECLGIYVGAVVGYAYNSKITRTTNSAPITILMENQYGQNTTYTHTGGIVGYMNGGEIRNCYNTASFGSVWWYYGAAGGIAGTFNNIARSRIKSCYYTGALYGIEGNNVYKGGIIGVSNDLQVINNTLYPSGFMSDCYAHKERSNEVIGYPYYNDVTYLIGDYYGLWNEGMKSDYFRDILNQAEPVGTWQRGTANDGYPYLGIEK